MNGQRGFTVFINQLQMASFGAFAGEVRGTFVVMALTAVDIWLLTRHATEILYSRAIEPLAASASVSVFMAHNTAAEQMRQIGLYLAGVIVSYILGKSVTSVFGQKNVRETAREYAPIAEAKERGKAQGTATVHADKIERVEVKPESPTPLSSGAVEDHQWASGDPRAGIL